MTDTREARAGPGGVGTPRREDGDRLVLAYDAGWLTRPDRFPVSLSLPLTSDEIVGGAARTFFANLLPEGAARQAVCARLGISVDNDFGLLAAIGGECAGALSLVPPGTAARSDQENTYEELAGKRLRDLVAVDATPLLIGGATTRLSLAGAQDKLPVAILDGALHLPIGAAPSTHILKLPNPRYPHLPENEAFVLGLARHLGLLVVDAELFAGTKPASLLVGRYDRLPSGDPWPVRRLHQEDLCQAVGLPPTRKYEAEGGPSLARAFTLIRAHTSQPLVEVRRLLEWQVFNIVAGNSDGHGKNLSLVYDEGGTALAPFYDLVSTRAYPSLDRKLAMSVGGQNNPDEIGRAAWVALSEDVGLGERVVPEQVRALTQRTLDELTSWTRAFREAHGVPPSPATPPRAITPRARRLLRALAPA